MFDRNLLQLTGMRGILAMLVLLALLQAACIAGQAFTLSWMVSALWGGSPLEDAIPFLVGFASCFALLQLVRFAQDTMLERYALARAGELRDALLQRVFDPDTLLARHAGGARISTMASDGIDDVQTYVRIIPPKIIGMVAISAPILICEYAIDWTSGIILTVMFPVTIFFMRLLGRAARERSERQYAAYTRLTGRFMDTLRGMRTILAFGAGKREERAVYSHSERLRAATMKTMRVATLSSAVLDFCATFGVAAVAIMLAFRLMDGSISLFTGLTALMLAPEYFTPIRSFANDYHASLDGKNALSAVIGMLDGNLANPVRGNPPNLQPGNSAQEGNAAQAQGRDGATRAQARGRDDAQAQAQGLGSDTRAQAHGSNSNAQAQGRDDDALAQGRNSDTRAQAQAQGRDAARAPERDSEASPAAVAPSCIHAASIRFQDVSYRYPDGTTGIERISFSAAAPEKVGVIGKSGSGKSTLANLFAGFATPSEGTITTSENWRDHVRYIPQRPSIFRMSLADNVRFYNRDAGDEAVAKALAAVGLDDLVDELPDGIHTLVGDGYRGLSGGEAHRVALARILVDSEAHVLVFDEPTAHLDIETEIDLKAPMLAAMEGKLVLFATHRLHWMGNMDRVISLDDGAREMREGRGSCERREGLEESEGFEGTEKGAMDRGTSLDDGARETREAYEVREVREGWEVQP